MMGIRTGSVLETVLERLIKQSWRQQGSYIVDSDGVVGFCCYGYPGKRYEHEVYGYGVHVREAAIPVMPMRDLQKYNFIWTWLWPSTLKAQYNKAGIHYLNDKLDEAEKEGYLLGVGIDGEQIIKLIKAVYGNFSKTRLKQLTAAYYTNTLTLFRLRTRKFGNLYFVYSPLLIWLDEGDIKVLQNRGTLERVKYFVKLL